MYGSAPFAVPPRVLLTPFAPEAIGGFVAAHGAGTPTSLTFVASGIAIAVPFTLTQPVVVQNLFWMNGATASGALDCGIYDSTFTRLVSTGSRQQLVVNALQTVSVAATVIPQGQFYLALSATGSVTIFRAGFAAVEHSQAAGVLTAASAFPLPATLVTSGLITTQVPVCGFALRTLVTS